MNDCQGMRKKLNSHPWSYLNGQHSSPNQHAFHARHFSIEFEMSHVKYASKVQFSSCDGA